MQRVGRFQPQQRLVKSVGALRIAFAIIDLVAHLEASEKDQWSLEWSVTNTKGHFKRNLRNAAGCRGLRRMIGAPFAVKTTADFPDRTSLSARLVTSLLELALPRCRGCDSELNGFVLRLDGSGQGKQPLAGVIKLIEQRQHHR